MRAFSDSDRERIKSKLLEHGSKIFQKYGLKKTSIANLSKAAGISLGAYYKFFGSKEELFFEIIEQEHEKIGNEILGNIMNENNLTCQTLKEFLKHSIELVNSNALLTQIYEEDTFELLIRKLPEKKLNEHLQNDMDSFLPLILHWQNADKMIMEDAQSIIGLFRLLFLIPLHKKEIGEENYEKTTDLLFDLVSRGLIKGGKN